MFSLSRFERAVTRRARALRGLRGAGIAFAASAALLLAAALVGRLTRFPVRLEAGIAALLFVLVAAAAGYLVGRARHPALPRLLLSIDLALGTGERLSSLHELRVRDAALPLQKRIEERLSAAPPAWRRVVHARLADALPWGGGVAGLLAAVVLVASVASPLPTSAAGGTRGTSPGSESGADLRPGAAELGGEGVPAGRLDPGEGETAEPLMDTLAEILRGPPSRGLAGDFDLEDSSQPQARRRDARSALQELLADLMRRGALMQNLPPLTEADKADLRDLLSEMTDPALRQSLTSLMNTQGGEALERELAETQRLLNALEESARGEGSGSAQATPTEDDPKKEEDAESIGWIPPAPAEEQNTGGSEGAEEGLEENAEGSGLDDETSPPPNEEGGTTPGAEATGRGRIPPAGAGFLQEELLGTLGSSGDVRRFFTKGVPFEPPAEDSSSVPVLSLDYETLRALLEARALSPEVQGLVRTYFEKITQGGS